MGGWLGPSKADLWWLKDESLLLTPLLLLHRRNTRGMRGPSEKHVTSQISVIVTVFLLEVGECQFYANYFSSGPTGLNSRSTKLLLLIKEALLWSSSWDQGSNYLIKIIRKRNESTRRLDNIMDFFHCTKFKEVCLLIDATYYSPDPADMNKNKLSEEGRENWNFFTLTRIFFGRCTFEASLAIQFDRSRVQTLDSRVSYSWMSGSFPLGCWCSFFKKMTTGLLGRLGLLAHIRGIYSSTARERPVNDRAAWMIDQSIGLRLISSSPNGLGNEQNWHNNVARTHFNCRSIYWN